MFEHYQTRNLCGRFFPIIDSAEIITEMYGYFFYLQQRERLFGIWERSKLFSQQIIGNGHFSIRHPDSRENMFAIISFTESGHQVC